MINAVGREIPEEILERTGKEDLFGNFSAYCVQHNYKSPLYTPDALARSMVRFAPS